MRGVARELERGRTMKSMRREDLRMRTTSINALVTARWFHSMIDAASSIV